MRTLPAPSPSVGQPVPFPADILRLPSPSVPAEVQSSARFTMNSHPRTSPVRSRRPCRRATQIALHAKTKP